MCIYLPFSPSSPPILTSHPPLSHLMLHRLLRTLSPPIKLIPILRSHPLWINLHRTSSSSSINNYNKASGEMGETIGGRFWMKFSKESTFSLYNPFVVCLASGKLRMETFRDYLAQDVYFLKAFAHAYELAAECADDDDAKASINQLRMSVLEELKMHGSFSQEWGLDMVGENTLNSATVKYTDFLLATASGKIEGLKCPGKLATPFERTKIAAYTLGAMTPCMRLYAYIGKELQALLESVENSTHPYKKWIENYSSEGFQESAQQTEDVLESLSVSLTGEELDIIEKLYFQAMKLELEFFCAQPLVQPTVVPLLKDHNPGKHHVLIFSDFDLTCTIVDSSVILGELAIVTAPKCENSPSHNQNIRLSSADLKCTWGSLSKQYTEEYEQCIGSILNADTADRFDHEGLRKALEKLSEFEKIANSRVIDSGVLKGLNLEDIKRAGERLVLQDGCTDFFKSITKNENINARVQVISFCWCADLIRSAFSSGNLGDLNIFANEFEYESYISTGEIIRKIETPIDKAQSFGDILTDFSSDKKNLTVYIGDSVGDLLCLLQADIGIVLGSSSSLKKLGAQFGVSFIPLFHGLVNKQKECVEGGFSNWKSPSGTLYTVSTWAEIHAFILGP